MLEAVLVSGVPLGSTYGNPMFLYREKLMSRLRKWHPIYGDLNDTVNFLFKEWQISQAYHIPRYAVYLLLGKQKLFIGVKILSFICQLTQ